jgi:hypothetical protein
MSALHFPEKLREAADKLFSDLEKQLTENLRDFKTYAEVKDAR